MTCKRDSLIYTGIAWSLMLCSLLVVLVYAALNKNVVISEVAGELDKHANYEELTCYEFAVTSAQTTSNQTIYVPLPSGVKAEDVFVENRYLDRTLLIHIHGGSETFYQEHPAFGDLEGMVQMTGIVENKEIVLKIETDSVYEFTSTMSDSTLEIFRTVPKEAYSKIIVIDPMEELSSIPTQVAKLVGTQSSNKNSKIYVLSDGISNLSDDEKIAFINEVQADYYIQLGLTNDDDSSQYGLQAYYNDIYYVPEFGNVQLAEALLKETCLSSINRTNGFGKASDDSILWRINVIGAQLNLGYYSNLEERNLLGTAQYRQALANGVLSVVDNL